jgi:uncharacterized membrane protein
MRPGRMEAFSDGVIAILITVMVLELHVPQHASWSSLREIVPTLLNYALSFVYLGIYWNNHHHMLQATHNISGSILWANLHLLFWLSLFPVTTEWTSSTDFAEIPVAVYGIVLVAAALAYYLLQTLIIRHQRPDSLLARAVGADLKGKLSPAIYVLGIVFAFVDRWISVALYVAVALIWLIPDRRVERAITASPPR